MKNKTSKMTKFTFMCIGTDILSVTN